MEYGVLKTGSGTRFYNFGRESPISDNDLELDVHLSSSLTCGRKQLEQRFQDVKSEAKNMLKQKLSLPTNTVSNTGRKSKSKSTNSKRKDEISRTRSYDHYSQIHKRMMLMNMQTKMLQVFGQVPPKVTSGSEVAMQTDYWVPSSAINLQESPRQNQSDIDFRLDSQWNKRMFDLQGVFARAPSASREISPTNSDLKFNDREQEVSVSSCNKTGDFYDDINPSVRQKQWDNYLDEEQNNQGYGEINHGQQIENKVYKDIIPSISDLLVNNDVDMEQQLENVLHNDSDLALEEISSNYATSISRTVPFIRTPSLISRISRDSSQRAPSYRSAWGEESQDQYCSSEKSFRSWDIDADDEWSDNESMHRYSCRHRHTKTMPKTSPADSSDDQIEESTHLKCQIIDRIERCVDYVSPRKSPNQSDKEGKVIQGNESRTSLPMAPYKGTVMHNKTSEKLRLFDSIMTQIKVRENMRNASDTQPRKTLSEVHSHDVQTEEKSNRFPWFQNENATISYQNKAVQRNTSHGRLKNTGGHNSGIIIEDINDFNYSPRSEKGSKQIKAKKSPKKKKKSTDGKSPRKSSIASKENESVISKEDTPKKASHHKRIRSKQKVSGKKKEGGKMSLFYISPPSSHGSICISDHMSDGSSEHAMPMVDIEVSPKKTHRVFKKSPSEGFDKSQTSKKKGKRKGVVERAPEHTQSVPSNLLISIPSRANTDISSVSVSKRPAINPWSIKRESKSVPKVAEPHKLKTTRVPPCTHIRVIKPIYKTDHEVKKESSSAPSNEKKKMDMIETLHRLPTTGSLQRHEELEIRKRTKQVRPFAVKKYNITDDADFLNRKKMFKRALHSDSSDIPSGRSSNEASPRPMQSYPKNKLPFNKIQGGSPQLFKTAHSLSPLLIQTSLQANTDGPKKFESFAKNVELSKRPAMIQGRSCHKGMQAALQSQFHFSSSSDELERLDDIREVEGLSQKYVQRLINPTPADSSSSSDDSKKIINPPGGQPKKHIPEVKKIMETPKGTSNIGDTSNVRPRENLTQHTGSTDALLQQYKEKCQENEQKFEKILRMRGGKTLGATASGPEISSDIVTAGSMLHVLSSDGNILLKDGSKNLIHSDIVDYKKDESLYEHQVKEFPTEEAQTERQIIKEAVSQLWKIAKTKSNTKRPSWNSKIKSKVHAAGKKGKKESLSPDKNDSSEQSLLAPRNTFKESSLEVGKTSRKNSLIKEAQQQNSGMSLNESDGEAAIQKVALSNKSRPIMSQDSLGTEKGIGVGKLSGKENTQESSLSNSILSNASVSDKGVKGGQGKKPRPVSPLLKKLRALSAKSSGASSTSKGTTGSSGSKVATSQSESTSKKEGTSKLPSPPKRPGSPKKKSSAPQRGSFATKKDSTSTSPKGKKTGQSSRPNSARKGKKV